MKKNNEKTTLKRLLKIIRENLGFIFALILMFLVFLIRLPYVVYTPGSLTDVSKRINAKDYNVSVGSYNLTSVRVVNSSLPFVLLAKLIPSWDIVPIEDIVLPEETKEEMEIRDLLYYDESISNAKIAALKEANIPHEIVNSKNIIVYVAGENKPKLKMNDEIILVDGYRINDIKSFGEYVTLLKEGQEVDLLIKRNGKEMSVLVKTYKLEDKIVIGAGIVTIFEVENNIDLFVDKGKRESGPSGGLLTSLAIYDAITPGDLTNGRKISGTGTIDVLGKIGEISGIKYKLAGSAKNNADVFIVPKENLEEALKLQKKHKYKIKIIGASTLKEAIDELRNN